MRAARLVNDLFLIGLGCKWAEDGSFLNRWLVISQINLYAKKIALQVLFPGKDRGSRVFRIVRPTHAFSEKCDFGISIETLSDSTAKWRD